MIDRTFENLAKLMDAKGVNQADLARSAGVNQSTLSRILNPTGPQGIQSPTDKQVRPLAFFFSVTADQLRGYQDLDVEATVGSTVPMDTVEWLQKIGDSGDPEVASSLHSIVRMFASGNLSAADAKAIEEVTRRFLQSTSAPKLRKQAWA